MKKGDDHDDDEWFERTTQAPVVDHRCAARALIVLAVFGHMLDTTYTSSQKISALEAVLHEVHVHIDRVEHKLDQLLDRR